MRALDARMNASGPHRDPHRSLVRAVRRAIEIRHRLSIHAAAPVA
jgi:hypothetical protein